MKGVKHYTEDGEYSGETHKMPGGKVHTGKKHNKKSKPVAHKPDGPFNMKGFDYPGQSPLTKRGLWDNIHAKRARGEKMRSQGDSGAPTEQAIKDSQ